CRESPTTRAANSIAPSPPSSELDPGGELKPPRRLRSNRTSEERGRQRADVAGRVHAIEHVECIDAQGESRARRFFRLIEEQNARPAQIEISVPGTFQAIAPHVRRPRVGAARVEVVASGREGIWPAGIQCERDAE